MRCLLLALVAMACRGGDGTRPDAVQDLEPDTIPLAMPEFPRQVPGVMAIRIDAHSSQYRVGGDWPAAAWRCSDPTVVAVSAIREGLGAIVLLGPPESGPDSVVYEVVTGTAEVPDPGTARVGLQILGAALQDYGLRGYEGTVEVEWVDSLVRGRFGIRMRESSFLDTILVAGAFDAVVRDGTEEACQFVTRRARDVRGPGRQLPR